MIVLWGVLGDGPLQAVYSALRARGSPIFLLDQHEIRRAAMDLWVDTQVGGTLRSGSEAVALDAVTAIYVRPYDARRIPALQGFRADTPLWRHALALDDAMQAWCDVTPALVVNRLSAMGSNSSKAHQAALIRSAGFDIPDTLITTSPGVALEFCDQHESVIYKSISGVRSIVSRLGPQHRVRLDDIGNCPTQFQQYIGGTDCRVHVVGNEIFACDIISMADDYRYASRRGLDVTIRSCVLEPELARRCTGLASALDLAVAGIDLRRSPDGRYYCFEVNPSPGFTFYQEATGQKIAEAIARLLD